MPKADIQPSFTGHGRPWLNDRERAEDDLRIHRLSTLKNGVTSSHCDRFVECAKIAVKAYPGVGVNAVFTFNNGRLTNDNAAIREGLEDIVVELLLHAHTEGKLGPAKCVAAALVGASIAQRKGIRRGHACVTLAQIVRPLAAPIEATAPRYIAFSEQETKRGTLQDLVSDHIEGLSNNPFRSQGVRMRHSRPDAVRCADADFPSPLYLTVNAPQAETAHQGDMQRFLDNAEEPEVDAFELTALEQKLFAT